MKLRLVLSAFLIIVAPLLMLQMENSVLQVEACGSCGHGNKSDVCPAWSCKDSSGNWHSETSCKTQDLFNRTHGNGQAVWKLQACGSSDHKGSGYCGPWECKDGWTYKNNGSHRETSCHVINNLFQNDYNRWRNEACNPPKHTQAENWYCPHGTIGNHQNIGTDVNQQNTWNAHGGYEAWKRVACKAAEVWDCPAGTYRKSNYQPIYSYGDQVIWNAHGGKQAWVNQACATGSYNPPVSYNPPSYTPGPVTPPPMPSPDVVVLMCPRDAVHGQIQTFRDVPPTSSCFQSVQNLECANVVHGFSDGYFHPEGFLTRGQMAKIIENGFYYPERINCGVFNDVRVDNKFFVHIHTLKCYGIANGFSDGSFRSDAYVTRGEAVSMIVNAARLANPAVNWGAAQDMNYGSSYNNPHYGNMSAAGQHNILPNGFGQDGYITRCEMSQLMDSARRIVYQNYV